MSKMSELQADILALYYEGYFDDEIARKLNVSKEMVENFLVDIEQEYSDYDDSMDGDFDSAMTSAGWGTEEDYGYYGEYE